MDETTGNAEGFNNSREPFEPLGFTPAVTVFPLGNTDANGTLRTTVTIPSNPAFHNGQLFAMAVLIDPAFPQSVDITNGADFTIVDRNVDLVGVSLAQYPHFTPTTAVNRGTPVEIALDPAQFRSLFSTATSVTIDAYVVPSKTRDAWIADPSLADINGTPRAITPGRGPCSSGSSSASAATSTPAMPICDGTARSS